MWLCSDFFQAKSRHFVVGGRELNGVSSTISFHALVLPGISWARLDLWLHSVGLEHTAVVFSLDTTWSSSLARHVWACVHASGGAAANAPLSAKLMCHRWSLHMGSRRAGRMPALYVCRIQVDATSIHAVHTRDQRVLHRWR